MSFFFAKVVEDQTVDDEASQGPTKLGLVDASFLRLLCGRDAAHVQDFISSRPETLRWMIAARGCRTLRSRLVAWARLFTEVLGARWGALPNDADAIIFEWTHGPSDSRRTLVRRFRPDTRLRFVDADSRIVRHPRLASSLMVVFRLLPILVAAPRGADDGSELGGAHVGILRQCLLALSHGQNTAGREAYLFRLYHLSVPIVAAFLKRRGIRANLVAGSTPLYPMSHRQVGDAIMLAHPFQVYEWIKYSREELLPAVAELWGPNEIDELEALDIRPAEPDMTLPDVLGVYTQGFRVRLEAGSIEPAHGHRCLQLEMEMLRLTSEYLEEHPRVHVIIFPHPIERRLAREGKPPFHDSLHNHPRVEVRFGGENSLAGFGEVGLGLTTFSTVGFDRLYLGLRTLFYVGGDRGMMDSELLSPFSRLFVKTPSELSAALTEYRAMSNPTFMESTFGELLSFDGIRPTWLRDLDRYKRGGR